MTLVVVPPLADPTTVPVGRPDEQVLDLNQRFATRMAYPRTLLALAARLDSAGVAARLDSAGVAARPDRAEVAAAPDGAAGGGVGRPGGGPELDEREELDPAQRCLLALAAADALAARTGPLTRLRALAAAIRAVSAGDAGVRACIDDILLCTGTTQSSADAMLAAGRCTLFDEELRAVPPGVPVHLLLDADQQLPAALRLVAMLGRGREVSAAGRFVAAHRDALGRLPELAHVRLVADTRPWEIDSRWIPDRRRPLRWVTSPAQCPPEGDWAGWLDAGDVLSLPGGTLARCRALVVTVGTFHPALRDLGAALPDLLGRIPVAIEIVVGAPGWPDPVDPHAGVPEFVMRQAGAATVRIAGFRPYRPAAGDGVPAPAGLDLARWAEPASPQALARLRGLLRYSAARHELFPGRVAGALFAADEAPSVVDGYGWDQAVRLVRTWHLAPAGSPPGDFLVSLRTGALTRIRPELAALLARVRHGGPGARRALGALAPERLQALLHRLRAAGVLRCTAVSR